MVELKRLGMGFRIIELETQNTNVPAITFYHSLGFELDGIGLCKKYYFILCVDKKQRAKDYLYVTKMRENVI